MRKKAFHKKVRSIRRWDSHSQAPVLSRQYHLKPLTFFMLERGMLASGLMASQLLLAPMAMAGPQGGVVISGEGSVEQTSPLDTHISQQSQNLLMNFDSFDVDVDESVLITQPNAAAWFVGQIVGGSPTAIFGNITANGKIALINPHGVVFGETATVNAAGIFASSLGLNAEDIFDGKAAELEARQGAGGYVVNHGLISASLGGEVTLLGETVSNTGVIVATLGQVNLASGRRAVVNFGSEQLIGIQITDEVLENNEGLRSAVSNTGTIDADGGAVLLTSSVSKSLFDYAVNNEGVIKAKSAEYKDGVIHLFGSGSSVLNTGRLDVSSEQGNGGQIRVESDHDVVIAQDSIVTASSLVAEGGLIELIGENVLLYDTSLIDVSGATSGGRLSITAVDTASLEAEVTLLADAVDEGDGGSISVSADTIEFFATASATGGELGGDGGVVELSATKNLTFAGEVDVSAPAGDTGNLILNALVVTIDDESNVQASALAQADANVVINASETVVLNDLDNNSIDLGANSLVINVDGVALSGAESDAIGFFMLGADDILRADGSVTVQVTDGSISANALIDIAGRVESKPQPEPLPNQPRNPGNNIALVANQGRIRIRSSAELDASAGEANTTAGSILVTANGFDGENEAGTILFSGQADVTSADGIGGTVKLLGDRVGLFDEAFVDASGASGGGEILVGGSFQGKGTEKNAIRTYVGSEVSLRADAYEHGDGGTVIVWADESTRFYGDIIARGGNASGDGGFVEVSGKVQLAFRGGVDTSAAFGELGELLLDPRNITISTTSTNVGGDLAGLGGDTSTTTYAFSEYDAPGTSSTTFDAIISPTTLDGLTASVTLQANQDILVSSPVSLSTSAASITLSANRDITLSAGITTTNGGVTLAAGLTTTGTVTIGAAIVAGTATVDVDADVISVTGGITADLIQLTAVDGISVSGTLAESTASAGSFDIDFGGGGGTDTANLGSAVFSYAGSNYGTIDGGAGLNTLIGRSGEAFVISGTNSGTIAGTNVSFGTTVGIENLTGNSGSESFTITLGGSIGEINAGAGAGDQVDITGLSSQTLAFASGSLSVTGTTGSITGVESIIGDSADSITSDIALTVDFSIPEGGTINTLGFVGFGSITGSTFNDSFTLSSGGSYTGVIDGGLGSTDTIDISIVTAEVVDLGLGTITSMGSFTGIERIEGSPLDSIVGGVTNAINGTGNDGTADGLVFLNFGTIEGTSGNDTFTIADGVTLGIAIDGLGQTATGTDSLAIAGSTGVSLDLNLLTDIEFLSGSSGTDTITNVNSASIDGLNAGTVTNTSTMSAGFSGFENLSGTILDDDFTLVSGGSLSGVIDGGTDTGTTGDVLTLDDNGNSITIEGAQTGLTSDLNSGGTGGFTGIESIVGGSGTDIFNFDAGAAINVDGGAGADIFFLDETLTGTVTGGAGNDVFNESATGIATSISGGSDTDTIVVEAGNNQINITATDTVNIDSGQIHSSIESVTGNTGNDEFVFSSGASLSGSIDGGTGTGTDVLNAAAQPTATNMSITGDGSSTSGVSGTSDLVTLGFDNIDTLIASSSAFGQLTGSADADQVTITSGTNTFIYNSNDSATFSNFTSLDTAGGNDTIDLSADLSGSIDGGAGTDTTTIVAGFTAIGNFDLFTEVLDDTGPQLITVSGGSGEVNLTGITSAGVTDGIDISATTLNITSGSGNAVFIESNGLVLGAVNVGAGSLTVTTSLGDILIGSVSAGGTVLLNSAGVIDDATGGDTSILDIVAAIIDLNATTSAGSGANDLELRSPSITVDTSDPSTGSININSQAIASVAANLTTGSTGVGAINFTQTGSQTLDITAASADGSITISNDGADITVTNLTAGGTTTNTVTVTTSGGLSLLSVSTAGDVVLNIDGDITDGDGGGTLNISADQLTISGGGNVTSIETSLNFLDLTTGVTTIANTGSLTLLDSTTTGTSTISSTTGLALNSVSGDTLTLSSISGDITDDQSGTETTITTTNNVTATTLILNASSIGAAGPEDTLEVTVAVLSTDTSGSGGNQFIDELDNVSLGSVNAGLGAVTLTAGGQINDASATDTTTADVTGTSVTLDAGSGIGGTNEIELAAGADLTAHVSGTGVIDVIGLGALTLTDVDTNNGGITVTAAGAVIATAVDAAAGTIDIDAAGQITATHVYTTGSGDVLLDTSTAGNILATDISAADAATLGSSGNITVGLVAAGGAASLTASSSIDDDIDDSTADIIAGQIELISGATGIGQINGSLDTDATTLAISSAGQVKIQDVGNGISIGTVGATTGVTGVGGIEIISTSPLTINNVVSDTGGGNILLAAEGQVDGDDLDINASVLTSGGAGSISLYAGDDITIDALVSTTNTGDVNVFAGRDHNGGFPQAGFDSNGTVTIGDGTGNISAGGDLAIFATGNIAVSQISGVNVSLTVDDSTFISSNSAGNITDNFTGEGAGSENITASTLSILASSGTVGSVDDLDIVVTNLAIDALSSSITETNSLILDASTIVGTFDLVTGGIVTQSGALNVSSASTFNSGNTDITLDNTGNVFGGSVLFNGFSTAQLSVFDTTALQLQSGLTVSNLTVNAAGVTQQPGALTVTGTTTLDSGANAIVLNSANDFQGDLIISAAGSASITDANQISLGASLIANLYEVDAFGINLSAAVNAGSVDFDVTAGVGNIIDGAQGTGSLNVSTSAVFAALTSDSILIDNTNNDFNDVAITSVQNAAFTDLDDINFVSPFTATGGTSPSTTSTVSGSLTVVSNGLITQNDPLSVTLNASFDSGGTTVGINDVTLNNTANDFSTVTVVQAANFSVADANNLNFGASTVDGALNVLLVGNLTQSGLLSITGPATFDSGGILAGTNDITLANAGNDFSTLIVTQAADVNLRDANSLVIGSSTVSGTLDVLLSGNLTQSGVIIVAGLTTLDSGGTVPFTNDIDLGNTGNNFSSLSISQAADVDIADTNSLILDASTINGTLNVLLNGNLSQSGAVSVSGVATFDSGGQTAAFNDITLDDSGNTFSTVVVTQGGNVTLDDADDLVLGAVTAGGALLVDVDNASISGSQTLSIAGIATFETGGLVTTTNDISLTGANNNFNSVVIANAGNVTLVDAGGIVLSNATVGGTYAVSADSIDLTGIINTGIAIFDASSGAGAISQSSGSLGVTGATTLTALTSDTITLAGVNNDFDNDDTGDAVTIVSGGNSTLVDSDLIILGASTVTGLLQVTADGITLSGSVSSTSVDFVVSGGVGDISDGVAGSLNVSGSATFTALTVDDIILDNSNDLNTVIIPQVGNVTIVDIDNIALSDAAVSGFYNVTADDVSITGSVIAASMSINSTGSVTDTLLGSLVVSGNSNFDVTGTDVITLDTTTNDFDSVTFTAGAGTVSLVDSNSIAIGASTTTGLIDIDAIGIDITALVNSSSLDLNAGGGDLTDTGGSLTVTNASTLTVTGANVITLDDPANNFGSVQISAGSGSVNLVDIDAISILGSAVLGSLNVTGGSITVDGLVSAGSVGLTATSGNITQSPTGQFDVSGVSNLTANGTNVITLDVASNDFGSVQVSAGLGTVTLVDFDNIDLDDSNLGGLFSVTAANINIIGNVIAGSLLFNTPLINTGGTIADAVSGDLTIAGNSVFSVDPAGSILLDSPTNSFGGSVTFSNSLANLALSSQGDIVIGGATVTNSLTVTAAGTITQSGVIVAPNVTLDAGGSLPANNITLTLANDFDFLIVTQAGDVRIVDIDELSINTSMLGGLFDIDSGTITIAGTVAANSIDFNSTGNILDSTGSLLVAGTSALTVTGTNTIDLDSLTNDQTSVLVSAGTGTVSLFDVNAIALGNSNTGGLLDVDASGIDVTGAVVVDSLRLDASGGDLTDTGGSLTVSGLSTLTVAGANLITLDAATNDFFNVLLSSGTGAVTLVDESSLSIGASTIGALAATVDGLSTLSINGVLTTTVGGVTFTGSSIVDINAAITSAAGITAQNIGQIQISPLVVTALGGNIDLDGGGTVTSLRIEGAGAVTLDADGDGNVVVPMVSDAIDGLATNLVIHAEGGVSTSSINLSDGTAGGALIVQVDNNDNGIEAATFSGALLANSITMTGTSGNDDLSFLGSVATATGNLFINEFQMVDVNAGFDSSGDAVLSNIGTIELRAGNSFIARGGDLNLSTGVTIIEIDGSGTVTLETPGNFSIFTADIFDAGDIAQTNLLINSGLDISVQSIDLNDGSVDGTLTINLDTNQDSFASATFNGNVSNVASFTVSGDLANNDNVLINANNDIQSSGPLSFNNLNTVELKDDVDLAGLSIDLLNSVTSISLTGQASNRFTSTGGNISLFRVDSSSSGLVLNAGTSDQISIDSYLGGGDIQVLDSGATTFSGQVTAGTVTLSDTTGAITFQGNTNIGSLITSNSPYSISFLGDLTTINTNAGFTNTGASNGGVGLILGNSPTDIVLFNAGATATASATDIAGSVRTSGDILTLGVLNVIASSTIDTTNNLGGAGAALNLTSTINSPSAEALVLNSGFSGSITVSGVVDNLSTLTVTDSGGVTFQNTVGQATALDLIITDTTAGNDVAFQGNTHLGVLTTGNQGYGMSFTGLSNVVDSVVTFNNTGGLILGNSSTNSILFDGGVTAVNGITEIAGSVLSSGDAISIGAVELLDVSTIDSTNGAAVPAGAAITLTSLNGSGVSSFNIDAGTGGVFSVIGSVNNTPLFVLDNSNGAVFNGDVGAVNPGAFTIVDTSDLQTIEFRGNTHLTTLTTSPENYNLSFLGNDNQIDNSGVGVEVTFTNLGSLTFGDDTNDAIQFTEGVVVPVASTTTVAGTVETINASSDLILETVIVADNSTATLKTGGGDIRIQLGVSGTDNANGNTESLIFDALNGDVILANINGVADPEGLTNVTIESATNVTFSQVALSGNLVQTSGTGLTTFSGGVIANNVTLTGAAFDVQSGLSTTGAVNVTNSGVFTLSGNLAIDANNGFSTSGSVNLAADINSVNSDITIGGNLIIADDQNISLSSAGGDLEIGGLTEGTQGGALDESLTISTLTGSILFGDIFGANSASNATGLTDVTITDSGRVTFGEIDITGALTQTNRASGNTIFSDTVSLNTASLMGTNFVFADISALGSVIVDASNTISQSTGTLFTVAGLLSVIADDATFDNAAASGGVNFSVTDDVTFVNNQAVSISGSIAGDFVINADGTIDLRPATSLSITGTSSFTTSDSLILPDLAATSLITLNVPGDATISNSFTAFVDATVGTDLALTAPAIVIKGDIGSGGIGGGDATLTATSSTITDSGDLTVSDLLTLVAEGGAGAITLDSPGNSFGRLDISSSLGLGAVVITEVDGTIIENVTANSFTLASSGDVQDNPLAVIAVNGVLSIDAGSNDVVFDNSNNMISTLEIIDANSVVIETLTALDLLDIAVTDLDLRTGGAITDSGNVVVTVTGIANFDSTLAPITLDNAALGTLSLTAGDVFINELDNLILDQILATQFDLLAGGNVTQAATSNLNITNTFSINGNNIVLDGAANTFGSIQLEGNEIQLVGSGDTNLENIKANKLTVQTSGDITQEPGSKIEVSGLAIFDAGAGDITLTDPNSTYGSISLLGGIVEFSQASDTILEEIDVQQLTLTSGGSITGTGKISVAGSTLFDAGTNQITLSNASNTFGDLSLTGSTVTVNETGNMDLDTVNVGGELTLNSTGDLTLTTLTVGILDATARNIREKGSAVVTVSGLATLDGSTEINLTAGQNRFGSLSLTSPTITLNETGGTILKFVQATTLDLTSPDAGVKDDSNATIRVTDKLTISAATDVIFGDNIGERIEFGTINITAANITISESTSSSLGVISSKTFDLKSAGDITQISSSILDIDGEASFAANSGNANVFLTQSNNTFGSLSVQAQDAGINEIGIDGTILRGVDVDNFDLVSAGPVVGTEAIRVRESLVVLADEGDAAVNLPNPLNRLNMVSVDGTNVVVANSGDIELVRVNAESLDLRSAGDVTDSPAGEIEVKGLAVIDAGVDGNIILGNNSNDPVQIGSVDFVGNRIELTQLDDVTIVGITAADELKIASTNGDITAKAGAFISAGQNTSLIVNKNNGNIDLSGSTNTFGDLTVEGRDVVVGETDDIVLERVDVDTLILSSGGSITNTDRSNINVILLADLTAVGDITLGDGAADSIKFGRVSLTAVNASIIEFDETEIAGLQIIGNLEIFSDKRITNTENSVLNVAGEATLQVSGDPQSIVLNGTGNTFGALDLSATDIDITLADGTSLTNVFAENFIINALSGTVSVSSGATFQVDQQAIMHADNIRFEAGSINEVGSLSINTINDPNSFVEIRSSITPRLISGNPTNPNGVIEINSPNVFIGVEAGVVALVTEGGVDGGTIAINGVNDEGFADSGSGIVHLMGEVVIDTTNGGASLGSNVTLVSDAAVAGLIRSEDGAVQTSLFINSGIGDVDLGDFDGLSRINNLTINLAHNVELDDVLVAGNTIEIVATGNVHISGIVDDLTGNVSISGVGSVVLDQSLTTGGDLALESTQNGVSVQDISASGSLSVAATEAILLGSNSTASGGTVTLLSENTIESVGLITAGTDVQIISAGTVDLGTSGSDSINSGGSASISTNTGDINITGITSGGDVTVFSVSGNISQQQDSVLSSGGSVIASAATGIEISSINAAQDVTLAITQEEVAIGEDVPTFTRVNDPIPIGQGNDRQDINSAGGAIVFLAPVADVGATDVGQNFVQRADGGIFYGLDQGQFFSDDIGGTAILSTIPENALSSLVAATAGTFITNTALSTDFSDPFVVIDSVAFSASLSAASSAEASAGETAASSSSRSTAASQQDEEEVAETDEAAFQNLKNYEENQQGILLPNDQQSFAYDDDGNIYFNITWHRNGYRGRRESITLYRIDLDLHSSVYNYSEEYEVLSDDVVMEPFWTRSDYEPSFTRLSMNPRMPGPNPQFGSIESGGGE